MRAKEIKSHMQAEPFRPIRIFVSDGSHYDVKHPELVLVTQTAIAIALDPGNGDVPEEMAYCDPVHVTRIKPIRRKKSSRPKRPRK